MFTSITIRKLLSSLFVLINQKGAAVVVFVW